MLCIPQIETIKSRANGSVRYWCLTTRKPLPLCPCSRGLSKPARSSTRRHDLLILPLLYFMFHCIDAVLHTSPRDVKHRSRSRTSAADSLWLKHATQEGIISRQDPKIWRVVRTRQGFQLVTETTCYYLISAGRRDACPICILFICQDSPRTFLCVEWREPCDPDG
jgi:hypothetical protein